MAKKQMTKRKPRRKLKPRPVFGFHVPARIKDFKVDHIIAEESPYEDPSLTKTRKETK